MLLFGPADWSALRSQGEGFDRGGLRTDPRRSAGRGERPSRPAAGGGQRRRRAGHCSRAGAEHLLGKRVAAFVGGLYAQYRLLPAQDVQVLPDEVPARTGASAFINPLTALGMVETMRREGHSALIHTAAASNLGQMLVRVTAAEGIPLEGSRDGCAKSAAKQVIET